MELQADRLEKKTVALQNELRYWTEVLQKSEKYERLKDNEDFQEVFKELRFVAEAHGKEIQTALGTLTQLKTSERLEAYDVILTHQTRLEQIEEALKEPERIIEMAKKARERIPEVKEEMRSAQEELAHA